jgi:flagellar biosynthesis protein FlhB
MWVLHYLPEPYLRALMFLVGTYFLYLVIFKIEQRFKLLMSSFVLGAYGMTITMIIDSTYMFIGTIVVMILLYVLGYYFAYKNSGSMQKEQIRQRLKRAGYLTGAFVIALALLKLFVVLSE